MLNEEHHWLKAIQIQQLCCDSQKQNKMQVAAGTNRHHVGARVTFFLNFQ